MIFAASDFEVSAAAWIAFLVIAPVLLGLELFVIPRRNPVPLRPALWFSLLWFLVGISFAVVVGVVWGEAYAIKYTSGFMIEKGLTIDQVLVFAFTVRRFAAPTGVGRRVVFIALVVGLLMRLPFIALGTYLGESDRPLSLVFVGGLFLGLSVLLVRDRDKERDPTAGRLARWLIAHERVVPRYHDRELVVTEGGRRELTLAGVLLVVLLGADLLFASTVPLGFSYSKPGFLVFASSTFSLLGFRSLFSVTAGLDIDIGRLKASLGGVFFLLAIDLFLQPFLGDHEPRWVVPLLGFLAVLVPVAAAVRGVEAELEDEDEDEPGEGGASPPRAGAGAGP